MLVFLFRFKDIGGVQILIFNLMRELYENGTRTKLIYFKDTWLTGELRSNNIEYYFYDIELIDYNSLGAFISSDDVLITTNFFMELAYFRKVNPYILFWNVYYSDLDYNKKNLVALRTYTRKALIDLMQRKQGLVFMDYGGVNYIEKVYGVKLLSKYMPVPIPVPDRNEYLCRNKDYLKDGINMTYLGRAVVRKIIPLKKVVQDIMKSPYRNRIKMHVITDNVDYVKTILDTPFSENEIIYHYHLTGEDLKSFLCSTSDIHMAMGTSCLEGASLGIPTILLNPSSTEYPDEYLYNWLFESTGFSLGLPEKITKCTNSGSSFSEIMSNFFGKEITKPLEISKKCYVYTKQNHDLKIIAQLFIKACHQSKLKVNDILYTDLPYFLKKIIFT